MSGLFARNDPDSLFSQGGNAHWNDRGQELVARETASSITTSMSLLPAGAQRWTRRFEGGGAATGEYQGFAN